MGDISAEKLGVSIDMDIPNKSWVKSWEIGIKPSEEDSLSLSLIDIFEKFWEHHELSSKSKTTIRRYSTSLHSIGVYIIDQLFNRCQHEYDPSKSAKDILLLFIDEDEGPWVYDTEEEQREIDLVSKKLYKYRSSNTLSG